MEVFVFCVAHYKKFAVYQKASIFVSHVIKELLVHAFSCACIELWMHWEVLRALKKLATPQATLTLVLCSPNFPCIYIARISELSCVQYDLVEK